MSLIEEFANNLQEIEYPTKEQEEKECWHIKGCLTKFSNQICKFDVRNMIPDEKHGLLKKVLFNSKADKIVFKTVDGWFIFDNEEFLDYFKSAKKNMINIDEVIKNTSFNWRIKIDC